MVELCLRMPELFPQPLPLLLKGMAGAVTLSQLQIACLLANAFFCTFPRRNSRVPAGAPLLPTVNFNGVFDMDAYGRNAGKIMCFVHYFGRITRERTKESRQRHLISRFQRPPGESPSRARC